MTKKKKKKKTMRGEKFYNKKPRGETNTINPMKNI